MYGYERAHFFHFTMSGRVINASSLDCLPDSRKKIGKRRHVQIYLNVKRLSRNFNLINKFLGNVFPRYLTNSTFSVFFEVNFEKRIPDCILLFSPQLETEAYNLYILEIKTTLVSASSTSIRNNDVHRCQYIQGLNQLRDSVAYVKELGVPIGKRYVITPIILFFEQNTLKVRYSRIFRSTTCNIAYCMKEFLSSREDKHVKYILSKPNTRVRATRKKRSTVSHRISK